MLKVLLQQKIGKEETADHEPNIYEIEDDEKIGGRCFDVSGRSSVSDQRNMRERDSQKRNNLQTWEYLDAIGGVVIFGGNHF